MVRRTEAQPTDIIPAGSITKSWTAAYCMHLIDRGSLHLDDPLFSLVDTFLSRTNGTTLLRLWGGDKTIEQARQPDAARCFERAMHGTRAHPLARSLAP